MQARAASGWRLKIFARNSYTVITRKVSPGNKLHSRCSIRHYAASAQSRPKPPPLREKFARTQHLSNEIFRIRLMETS